MTVIDLLFSLQGLMVIIIYLFLYSFLFYMAFLALVDVHIASSAEFDYTRIILYYLTLWFLFVTVCSMFASIYQRALELCKHVEDRTIVDVIMNDYDSVNDQIKSQSNSGTFALPEKSKTLSPTPSIGASTHSP